MNKESYIEELENKLMYALSPTTHELSETTKRVFKEIIRNNINEDTYTIRKLLKERWNASLKKLDTVRQMEIYEC